MQGNVPTRMYVYYYTGCYPFKHRITFEYMYVCKNYYYSLQPRPADQLQMPPTGS